MTAAALVLGTIVLLGGQALPGPQAPTAPVPPTGLILGRAVDAATGRPVRGAIVSLEGAITAADGTRKVPPRALTNANGQFVFRRVSRGFFGLTATKAGYVEGAYGRRRPGGAELSFELADGERNGDVVIPMWRVAAITGTVTDEAGEPLMGVEMRIFERRYLAGKQRLTSGPLQTTDDRGIYRFGNLSPGDYVVAFVAKEVTMPTATAAIIRSMSNDPRAQEIQRERMGMGIASFANYGAVLVDGLERQFSPGTPMVPPSPVKGGPVYVYPTQFFPGTPALAQAATLTLKSGDERGSVDFTLRPAKTTRVSGTVIGPDGPVANVALRLVPNGDDFATEIETSATMSGASGEFTFLGVVPEQYAVKVMRIPRPPTTAPTNVTSIQVGGSMMMSSSGNPGAAPPRIPADPTLWASVPVGVTDADVTDVSVVLQRGARLSGRLEFDGTRERPDPQQLVRVPIMIERADRTASFGTAIPPGRVDESGAFTTYGLPGGRYLVRVGGNPPGWTLRSVISEGRDISDTPLDLGAADAGNVVITFTDRPTKLTGSVRGAGGNADSDALVVIFPADNSAWTGFGLNPRRIRSTRVLKSGAYTFSGLPPGDYIVAAVKDEAVGSWQHPEMLEALSRLGTSVRLLEGDTRTQDLKTGVVR